jgi:hypothetical protein
MGGRTGRRGGGAARAARPRARSGPLQTRTNCARRPGCRRRTMGPGMPLQVKASCRLLIAAAASAAVPIFTSPHPLDPGGAAPGAPALAPGRKHLTASTRPNAPKSDLMSFSVVEWGARAKNSCRGATKGGGRTGAGASPAGGQGCAAVTYAMRAGPRDAAARAPAHSGTKNDRRAACGTAGHEGWVRRPPKSPWLMVQRAGPAIAHGHHSPYGSRPR